MCAKGELDCGRQNEKGWNGPYQKEMRMCWNGLWILEWNGNMLEWNEGVGMKNMLTVGIRMELEWTQSMLDSEYWNWE